MARQRPDHCSFCGKGREQVHRLIAGPRDVSICDECVGLCDEIIMEGQTAAADRQKTEAGQVVAGSAEPAALDKAMSRLRTEVARLTIPRSRRHDVAEVARLRAEVTRLREEVARLADEIAAFGERETMRSSGPPRVGYHCSFCAQSQEEAHRLIAGPGGVYICDDCIALCDEIIAEQQTAPADPQTTVAWRSATVSRETGMLAEELARLRVEVARLPWSGKLRHDDGARLCAEIARLATEVSGLREQLMVGEEALRLVKPPRVTEHGSSRVERSQSSTRPPHMQYRCSFCRRSQEQVLRLIAGPGDIFICDRCIALGQEIIDEEVARADPGTAVAEQSAEVSTEKAGLASEAGRLVEGVALLCSEVAEEQDGRAVTADQVAHVRTVVARQAAEIRALRRELHGLEPSQ